MTPRRPLPLRPVAALLLSLSVPALATTPPSQDVTVPTAPGVFSYTWTGTSPVGAAGGGSTCASTGVPDPTEDGHIINLTVPAGTYDTLNVRADFHVEWTGGSDLVLTLEKDGEVVDDSDGGTPEENITVNNPEAGEFAAVVCSFLAASNTPFSGRLTLTATAKDLGNGDTDLDDDGVANVDDICPDTPAGKSVDAQGCSLTTATGLPPRFQLHVAPTGMGDDAGEPSVGYNKFTQRTMFISYVNALRQTYWENADQDAVAPPMRLPASCPALWEDKSGLLTTANSLDPILFTDEATGRTFNSQLSGANSLFEFTDDDGENWTVGQLGAPNGGADHQTVASGPFPVANTPPSATWPASGPKRAVYYCSQSVATAFCSRSDDGGRTFGPGFTFKNTDCARPAACMATSRLPRMAPCTYPTVHSACCRSAARLRTSSPSAAWMLARRGR